MREITPLPANHVDDFNYCLAQLRRLDRERYWTLLFIAPERRWRIAALYAFNLEIARTREVVSETLLGEMRLQWWHDTINGIFEGNHKQHQVVNLLAAALSDGTLDRRDFHVLIDARRADLAQTPFEDLESMTGYAADTGGKLTTLACRIACESAPQSALTDAAQAIGTAYALTGLLRRCPHDARAQRLLLPPSLLQAHGAEVSHFIRGQAGTGGRAAVAEIAKVAEAQLQTGCTLLPKLPRIQQRLLLSGRIVARHLARLRRAAYDPFAPPFNQAEVYTLPDLMALGWAALKGQS